jgi:hypothetical protein
LQTDIKILLTAVVVMAGISSVLTPLYSLQFTAYSLAGCIVLMLRTRRRGLKIISSFLMALLVAAAWFLTQPGIPARATPASFVLALFGMGSLITLGLATIWSTRQEAHEALTMFAVGLFPLLFLFVTAASLLLTIELNPKTLDLYLVSADGSLGFQPSFAAGRLLRTIPVLGMVERLIYDALPLMMMVCFSLQRNRRSALHLLSAVILAGVVGWLGYNVYPAVGPAVFFGNEYPFHAPGTSYTREMVLQPLTPAATVRNCMPSLHFAWVLLLWWGSGCVNRIWRCSVLAFVVLTVLATLGLGEHYLFDLVVAFPFALTIHAGSPWSEAVASIRARCLATSIVLTAAWLIILRFYVPLLWTSTALPWSLVIATVCVCLKLETALLRDVSRERRLNIESQARQAAGR